MLHQRSAGLGRATCRMRPVATGQDLRHVLHPALCASPAADSVGSAAGWWLAGCCWPCWRSAGCVNLQLNATVHSDDTVSGTARVGVAKSLAALAGGTSGLLGRVEEQPGQPVRLRRQDRHGARLRRRHLRRGGLHVLRESPWPSSTPARTVRSWPGSVTASELSGQLNLLDALGTGGLLPSTGSRPGAQPRCRPTCAACCPRASRPTWPACCPPGFPTDLSSLLPSGFPTDLASLLPSGLPDRPGQPAALGLPDRPGQPAAVRVPERLDPSSLLRPPRCRSPSPSRQGAVQHRQGARQHGDVRAGRRRQDRLPGRREGHRRRPGWPRSARRPSWASAWWCCWP